MREGVLALVCTGAIALAGCGGSNSDNGGGAGKGGSGGAAGQAGTGGGAGFGVTPGEPISAPDKTWTWVPFPESKCRDGSPTGMAVSLNSASTKVTIYMQGGGACFNTLTCATNPTHFGEAEFNSAKNGFDGLFDRTNAANPLKDDNFFMVPYCTGDIHAGNAPNAPGGNGVPPNQYFVGYANFGLYLPRIIGTVPKVDRVLLSGSSAGGFGAAANFVRTQKAFGGVPVTLLDDAGPTVADKWATPCLQQEIRDLWGLESTVLAECGAACPDHDDFMENLIVNAVSTHPDRMMALDIGLTDSTISQFLGFGQNNCPALAGPLSASEMTAALVDLRDRMLAPYPNFGTYYVSSSTHTFLGGSRYFSTTVNGVKLTDYVADLLNGKVSNVHD